MNLSTAAGVALFGLVVYGKWKLLTTPAVGILIIVGALLFVASTPARAE